MSTLCLFFFYSCKLAGLLEVLLGAVHSHEQGAVWEHVYSEVVGKVVRVKRGKSGFSGESRCEGAYIPKTDKTCTAKSPKVFKDQLSPLLRFQMGK